MVALITIVAILAICSNGDAVNPQNGDGGKYILTKNQFGFDDFFTLNIITGMEGIDFGAFYWQSANNSVKLELV